MADKNFVENEEELVIDESTLDGIEAQETLKKLKRRMLKYACNLQFEAAALLRDKIRLIEEAVSAG